MVTGREMEVERWGCRKSPTETTYAEGLPGSYTERVADLKISELHVEQSWRTRTVLGPRVTTLASSYCLSPSGNGEAKQL